MNMKMKRLFVLVISVAVILLIALSVQCQGPSQQEKADKKKTAAAEDKKTGKDEKAEEKDTDAVPVQVVAPTIGDISSFLLFSSNIDSEKVVDIFPMTTGIIEKINFDEGQHVETGAVLAVLDEREASINERKAEINHKKLKAEFERQKEIFERQMISKEEYERLRFNMENAKLEWEHTKLLLSYTRITSPIDGVVTKRYIKVGNKINTSQMAFSVVQDKEKIAVVNIPEQEKDAVFIKQKALIFSGAKNVTGSVKRMSPAIDPESGTFKVTVGVNDKKGVFAVGQFVNVKIIKKVHKNVVLLTKDALVYEGGKIFVFVVNEKNEALKKQVKLGFEEGNQAEIVEGLAEKERVVTAGKSSLKNKTLVKIVEPVIS
ncbi:MAG: efflux RND transporter periplasmic adaptor subunit [Candidatus Aminicenantes bacterium]|nr:efflux RND transporter periplasmic adaptor subunit [Candidatus Aminicenantes bacterium]NIM84620.1 efflux RND transporter periplasmic adaptor subunit [Candidatus Aminicenantes bacterium]NIN21433.1 efflux RND transporter periplasmic adaptor subunit [Candidatus Aminicenantes bacterium]NIN47848.1 efflux RND transporter periplasmic adaptor subunit [Candidatus Aminicenantes bacterium]NIN90786.1 efflux RND transporter periplasmic adaptor subunit [Candidatus Aminicenantes bacterium]